MSFSFHLCIEWIRFNIDRMHIIYCLFNRIGKIALVMPRHENWPLSWHGRRLDMEYYYIKWNAFSVQMFELQKKMSFAESKWEMYLNSNIESPPKKLVAPKISLPIQIDRLVSQWCKYFVSCRSNSVFWSNLTSCCHVYQILYFTHFMHAAASSSSSRLFYRGTCFTSYCLCTLTHETEWTEEEEKERNEEKN